MSSLIAAPVVGFVIREFTSQARGLAAGSRTLYLRGRKRKALRGNRRPRVSPHQALCRRRRGYGRIHNAFEAMLAFGPPPDSSRDEFLATARASPSLPLDAP